MIIAQFPIKTKQIFCDVCVLCAIIILYVWLVYVFVCVFVYVCECARAFVCNIHVENVPKFINLKLIVFKCVVLAAITLLANRDQNK